MARRLPAEWVILIALTALACHKSIDPLTPAEGGCRSCHGGQSNAAPPRSVDGTTDTAAIGVGAHQTHVVGGALRHPVGCEECHVSFKTKDDPGHMDHPLPAILVFGKIATSSNAAPIWNHDSATCANTYCHGKSTPIWTKVDGTQAACGTCHGLPPPAPHPASQRCEMCHLETAGPNLTVADETKHIDGIVEVTTDACMGCHGSAENLAPPKDTHGGSDTKLKSVGAHQAHMSGGFLSAPVACATCHPVPSAVTSPGHIDGKVDLVLGGLALTGGASPSYDPAQATCQVYCHGDQLTGGSKTNPVWTTANGTEAACGTCHGLPPPAPHPQATECQVCHAPTAGPNLTIANKSTHVDGVVQVASGDCTQCHGSPTSSAPPKDTLGNSDIAKIGVGAHRAHLEAPTNISRPIACSECHLVPAQVDSPGHIDHPLPATMTWGPLSSAAGAAPAWNHDTGTCMNTYCHGSTLQGGALTAPSWTRVDGSQIACGSCHGLPPAAPHPQDQRCEACHLPSAGPNKTIANPATHVDGIVQVASQACDSCHGSNGNSAPPRGIDGARTSTATGVGAHRAHLAGGLSSRPVACGECHVVPAAVDSPGHIDHPPPAYVIFGPTATVNAHAPAWDRATDKCANTYCHGSSAPIWTKVDGTQAPCGGCHGLPPPAPHPASTECALCHAPTAGPNMTIANRATHVDGILQVATGQACNACHGDATSSAPPIDLDVPPDTAPTDDQVGAHRAHLSGGSFSAAVSCDACHVVPTTVNEPGHMDHPRPAYVIFHGTASANLTTPAYDPNTHTCSNVYCHGATLTLGQNTKPVWNQPGTAQCGTCHGLPPAAPHPQVAKCEICHAQTAGPNFTIADKTKHIDGIIEVNDLVPCQSCHGTAMSAAPPLDLMGMSASPTVGAHAAHMNGTGRSLKVPCSECHNPVNPATPNQPGHYDAPLPARVIFGVLAKTGAQSPSYTAGTCANTYCHGATLPNGTTTSPTWSGGQLACDACHGMPPRDSTHGNGTATNCVACHPDTAGPNQTIAHPEKHIDGIVETSATCDTCHGQAGDPTPPKDVAGNLSSAKIGVHQAHEHSAISAPVACTSCHVSVTSYNSPGHVDHPYPANVIFSGLASAVGTSPTYDTASETCSGTYCHGSTMPGGTQAVVWSDMSGTAAQCTGCHGMPPNTPAHAGQTATSCNTCHSEVAGPNATIVNPALHVDGLVQAAGGGCTSCHGDPPSPTTEKYPGSAGAHATHANTLGFQCATCHGNNGSGPNHNQGNGVVIRSNVNIIFDPTVRYTGGTTMLNGQTSNPYTPATFTCQVGCHNPIVNNPNETPNLTVPVSWGGGPPGCLGCHDQVATTSPRNHNVAGQGDAGCLTCHSMVGHTTGVRNFVDPNPNDAFSYAPGNIQGLCKTCHDGWTGTAFGGQSGLDVNTTWVTAAHNTSGLPCTSCHAYHSQATTGPLFLDKSSSSCEAAGCHANLTSAFNDVAGGPPSHHPIEGGAGITLSCESCHNAHVSQASPLAAVDPGNRWALYSIPATAVTQTRANGDYTGFCLKCHTAVPPAGVTGALNIASALAGGADPSAFTRGGGGSLHSGAHGGFNCENCHDHHASQGTAGTNRGHLLFNFINVSQFPYQGFGSCSTSPSGVGFSCH